MSEPTPKDSDLIQAQIAAFAAERVRHYEDKAYLLGRLVRLGAGEIQDVSRVTEAPEWHSDEDGLGYDVPKGSEVTVAKGQDYIDFLRSVGGSQYESIEDRADLIAEECTFTPIVRQLKSELTDPKYRTQHPAYLGSGSASNGYRISHEGEDFAVRIPHSQAPDPHIIDNHLAATILGKGVPHLEQIVAASYDDGVTVAELMPGREAGDLDLDTVQKISDAQLDELLDTLTTAHQRGIEFDAKPSNIFYDPEAGFGIIDYGSSKVVGRKTIPTSLGKIMGMMTGAISTAGFHGRPYDYEKSPQDYANDAELHSANLGVLERYRELVSHRLAGQDLDDALALIDPRIEAAHQTVDKHNNPDWVAQQIERNQRILEKRAQHAANIKQTVSVKDDALSVYL